MAALNKNNSAIRRIMSEARELENDPSTDYSAAPLEDDIFEWHCTIRGPAGTEFEGGLYHLRIVLPAEYPFRPPSIMVLTPNGRFELNTKICISFTNYHEELWQPAWGVRTAILGLQGFLPLKGQAAVGVGAIEYPPTERKRLAALSREWVCPHCKQSNLELLPDPMPSSDALLRLSNTETIEENPASTSEISPTVPDVSDTDTHSSINDTIQTAAPDATTESLTSADGPLAQSSTEIDTPSNNPELPHLAAHHIITQSSTDSPSLHSPPILLDGAIVVLLVLVFALVCRRMF